MEANIQQEKKLQDGSVNYELGFYSASGFCCRTSTFTQLTLKKAIQFRTVAQDSLEWNLLNCVLRCEPIVIRIVGVALSRR